MILSRHNSVSTQLVLYITLHQRARRFSTMGLTVLRCTQARQGVLTWPSLSLA
jgi:hypothetical protein